MNLKSIIEKNDTTSGRFFDIFIESLIILSLVSFTIETIPNLSPEFLYWLNSIETFIVIIFSIEYILRIIVADNKLKFIFSFYGLIDLTAILPFYISRTVDLRSIRIFRLFRLFRAFKLFRYSRALKRFRTAFSMIKEELIIFLTATMFLLFISSVGIYYFENAAQPDKFTSIFDCMWWSIATLTTVGYGDVFPITVGAIAKICDKLKIPVPGLGYWRKIEVGIKVNKDPLPDLPPNTLTTHVIRKYRPDYEINIPEEVQKVLEYEKDPKNKIEVPQRRGLTHYLLKKTLSSLRLIHPRSRFLTSSEGEGIFEITVSPRESKRTFRILNTLITELEKRKYLAYINRSMICVKMYGMEIGFKLKEKSKRIELPLKPGQIFKDYDFLPTSELILSLKDFYSDQPLRRNFTDNKLGRLEDKLNDFIIALIIAAHAKLARERYIEQMHNEMREKERRKNEVIEKIKLEEKKVEELLENVEQWHKSELIRGYVEEYKNRKSTDSLSGEEKEKLNEYIKWALEQADRISPFIKSPYSIIDEKDKYYNSF